MLASLDGIDTTILAYGQTSSGKTHTMIGDIAGQERPGGREERGLCQLAVEEICARMQVSSAVCRHRCCVSYPALTLRQATEEDPDQDLSVAASFLQVKSPFARALRSMILTRCTRTPCRFTTR